MTDQRLHPAESVLPTDLGDRWARRKAVQTRSRATLVDENAFRSFYERTAPSLRSYLRLLSRDAALADDLLQESYFRFLRAGVSDLNEFQMKAYLYKAATSAASDHWRRLQREQRWLEDPPRDAPAGNPNLSPDIDRLFRSLDARQQTLLWLAHVEGFRHREIAETLGLKERSVRVMLLRARRRLAGMLAREGLAPKETS